MTFSFLPADIVSQILNFGSPAALDVQIAGHDIEGNRAYAYTLLSRNRRVAGVADARIQEQSKGPALRVDFNRALAGVVGLTEGDAATSVQASLSGSTQTAPTYWLDPRNGVSYPVSVQTPQYSIDTLGDLNNLPITAARSEQLLGGLSTISPEPLSAVVTHYNVMGTVNILAAAQSRDLGGTAADIQRIIDETKGALPKGSTVAVRGQVVTMSNAYQQLLIGLGFSIVLIYLLIVINFQSWLDPFVIIMALPAALAGIVWMLFVTQTHVSVPALTGAIMCMGVATANSILVISFAREQLAVGLNALDAAWRRARRGLRPVIMTALAMVIGMLPMAIEPGQNAPLGRAVIGGLLFATTATLFFVPVVFAMVHGRARGPAAESLPVLFPLRPSELDHTWTPSRRQRPPSARSSFSCSASRRAPRRWPIPASPTARRACRRSKPGPRGRPSRPSGWSRPSVAHAIRSCRCPAPSTPITPGRSMPAPAAT